MWVEFPRWFGYPSQLYLQSKESFDNLFKIFNGKTPIFVSCYRFPERDSVIVDSIMLDLDYKSLNIKKPFEEVKRLAKFCEENSFEYAVIFSGNKGFHFYIPIRPLSQKLYGKMRLREIIYSIQKNLIDNLKLTTIDVKLLGRLNHLVRFPTSKYVGKSGKKTGYYCRYIEDLPNKVDDVLKLAKTKGSLPQDFKHKLSYKDLIQSIPNFRYHRVRSANIDDGICRDGTTIPTLDIIVPCLRKHIQLSEPPHVIRLETTAYLKFLGYRDSSILNFYRNLYWRDFDPEYTYKQILSIKPRLPSCSLLSVYLGDEYCRRCYLRKK